MLLRIVLFTFLGLAAAYLALGGHPATAQELDRAAMAARIDPPYALGEDIAPGAWELVNLDSRLAGYAFESKPLAPLPGFSGAPINLLVAVTLEGRFIDVEIVSHNEPIFVSGLGEAAFHEFVRQYKGLSINDPIVVGVPYGGADSGSSLVYLKGVTKATASVRIAHESVLAAAFAIARDRMAGLGPRVQVQPKLEIERQLTWDDLVRNGIAARRLVTNAEADSAFAGTLWEDDDPLAKEEPDQPFLDLWVIDVGPREIAAAVLTPETLEKLARFMEISKDDEPILVIDAGRHGLVSEDFVRNTSPDLLAASQDGLPLALRDADIDVALAAGVPGNVAMILRSDQRIGFDPTREWILSVRAVREHGFFQPQIGTADFSVTVKTDEAFFIVEKPVVQEAPWKQALSQRAVDLAVLAIGLAALGAVLLGGMRSFAAAKHFTPIRLAILAVVIGFVGWWGQGQLSIVTVLGVVRGVAERQSLEFLLYDPFSLLIWAVAIVSFILWGRGFYCGWLCPFGAMQEFAHHAGRLLGLKALKVPDRIDKALTPLKYAVLALLVAVAMADAGLADKLVEIEPFKTAVTTYFVREWYFVLYAVGLLVLSMTVFKAFCRYLCPLGAVMAIGGLLRVQKWIPRRTACGTPCQLCRVRCNYNAIERNGAIRYSECFQCLDCVTIHDDTKQCVPLVLAAKGRSL